MKTFRMLCLGAAVVAATALLVACPESSSRDADQGRLIDPNDNRATTRPTPATFPTPIRMEKPKLLGPVTPAIITLPDRMREPMIRVRLTAERDAQPSQATLNAMASKYRGTVDALRLPTGKYVVVNTLPMDSYLQGVLAKEIYGSWQMETFKAQAVAARTYALFQLLDGDAASRAWDVANDESSQMYGGIAGETLKARQAVAATKGQILVTAHAGQVGVFCAFFSASAGAASQDPFEAWGDPSPLPLRARKLGPNEKLSERFAWTGLRIAKTDIARCINAWAARNGIAYMMNLADIRQVTVARRNASTGRPIELALRDSRGRTVPIRAEEFRLSLIHDPAKAAPKPFSSHFDIQDAGDSIILVNGYGHGHGIGLSQWGAESLARQGSSFSKILAHYYPGSTLRQAW